MVEHPTKRNNQLSNTKYETQEDGENSETMRSVKKEAYDYGNEDVWPRVDRVENTERSIANLHNLQGRDSIEYHNNSLAKRFHALIRQSHVPMLAIKYKAIAVFNSL